MEPAVISEAAALRIGRRLVDAYYPDWLSQGQLERMAADVAADLLAALADARKDAA